MKKFAVILAGCGVYDGAEIHEAVMTLYAIEKAGCSYQIFAPNINQHHVVNHFTGNEMPETRSVLIESARIARGKIENMNAFDASNFDAIIFPGGFGVAKNLCTWAFDGSNAKVNVEIEKAVKDMLAQKKPIGALCIAPAMIAKILGNVEVTIGSDAETASEIEKLGAKHIITTHGEVVIDKRYKLVTTPCYMLEANILQIVQGAENAVNVMLDLMD